MALLLIVLAPLAATLIQLAISCTREFEADRLGAKLTGDRRSLAYVLAKLENANRQIALHVSDSLGNMFTVVPLTRSAVSRLFMTHSPIEERIRRLTAME